ncbi:alpha/beta hydrolase family protein [Paenibacillus sp. KN14-4R]|uniref:alpha/beta hydrolase family protein n=1 Tax=Paenibacillus sp. KN14-4R TaxID=3445773 RepID=UPI003FA039E2
MGNSAGGFIASGIFSKNLSLPSAIVMNGSCAWVKFEEQICERDRRAPWASINKGLVEKFDPIHSIQFLENGSMLILHGTEDTTIPIESQKFFMQLIEQNSLMKSVKFVEYTKVNHHITLGMLEEAKNWLSKLEDNTLWGEIID